MRLRRARRKAENAEEMRRSVEWLRMRKRCGGPEKGRERGNGAAGRKKAENE